jgi:hypothetical protein
LAQKQKSKSNQNNVWLLLGAVALMVIIIWASLRSTGSDDANASTAKSTISTLDPAKFTGRAREAYQAAREIPQVLSQLPCYCGCMQNFGHKNNLYCFHDDHGADCSLCQDIAIDAREMYRQGKSVEAIRNSIRDMYARYAP